MSSEFGMQAAQVGLNLVDGLGNMWADKVREKKIKEELQEQRELEESYRERMLGPGQGGGFSEHLASHDQSNTKYFMPAIASAAEMGYYQLATNIPEWIKKFKAKRAAKDSNSVKNPEDTGDATAEGLTDIPVAAAGEGNPSVQNNIGMNSTGNPVGMAFPGNLIMGSEGYDAESLANSAQIAMMYAKKGTKLIPRQK